jgi:phosphoribosylformylglycinamidine synthase
MKEVGIAVDGGKDSLSMAVKVKSRDSSASTEVVKSPGTIVISAYAPVPDIRVKVTPELKGRDFSLIHIDLSGRKNMKSRSGASALAQVFNQVGDSVPDIDDSSHLKRGFQVVQKLIRDKKCTAGHDISDGGLITCILEMAFASNLGLDIVMNTFDNNDSTIDFLFAEEAGVVIEVPKSELTAVEQLLKQNELKYQVIGHPVEEDRITVKVNGETVVDVSTSLFVQKRFITEVLPLSGKDDSSP